MKLRLSLSSVLGVSIIAGLAAAPLLSSSANDSLAQVPNVQLTEPTLEVDITAPRTRMTFRHSIEEINAIYFGNGLFQFVVGLGYEASILAGLNEGKTIRMGLTVDGNISLTIGSETHDIPLPEGESDETLYGWQGSILIAPNLSFFRRNGDELFGVMPGVRLLHDSRRDTTQVSPEIRIHLPMGIVIGASSNFRNFQHYYIGIQATLPGTR